jgi:hypothetical protein
MTAKGAVRSSSHSTITSRPAVKHLWCGLPWPCMALPAVTLALRWLSASTFHVLKVALDLQAQDSLRCGSLLIHLVCLGECRSTCADQLMMGLRPEMRPRHVSVPDAP